LNRARVGYAVLLTSQGLAFIHAGDEMFRTKETTWGATPNTKSNQISHRTFMDNSYNASDAINMVKWNTVYASDPILGGFTNYATANNGYQLYAYVQGLIALRKSTNAFRLPDANRAANVTRIDPVGVGTSTLAFGYKCVASTVDATTYYVFHNTDTSAKTFNTNVDLSTAVLLVDGAKAGAKPITLPGTGVSIITTTGVTAVTLQPQTSAVLKK
jgi:pullulanase/glycogen debranching enzyme